MAAEVLRQGILRPDSAMLGAGLRLHAELLRRFCPVARLGPLATHGGQQTGDEPEGDEDGELPTPPIWEQPPSEQQGWWYQHAKQGVESLPQTLLSSSDPRRAAHALLAELLPQYLAGGGARAGLALGLLQAFTAQGGPEGELRGVPELGHAVREVLRCHFPSSDWTRPGPAEHAAPELATRLTGLPELVAAQRGGEACIAACVESSLRWWLSDPAACQGRVVPAAQLALSNTT